MPKKPVGNKTTALSKYDEQFAKMAAQSKAAVSNVGAGGNFLSLKGGFMTYQGGQVPENRLRCVIIDAIAENQFYTGKYDPDNPGGPACFAFGRKYETGELIMPKLMAPDKAYVVKPIHDTCSGCPNNEWGSADVGKGKACKEVQRLALIVEGDLEKDIEGAEEAYLKVPVTSMKAWAGYVRMLTDTMHKAPAQVVTEITQAKDADPRAQPGWHLEFKFVADVDTDALGAILAKYDIITKKIAFPYTAAEDSVPKKKSAGRR
jgi:hypothetical protein